MSHQSEIEKEKYRHWVKGGLAYKYLKQGLESYADDVVKQEHRRILAAVNYTVGTRCNHCCIKTLLPIHTCKRDNNRKKICPHGVFNCNCLHGKKLQCPSFICGEILEEILKNHGSTPPTPNWANTDIQRWCTEPWEVAKCFINAPGYSDKMKAADIDISGLLHVFINNTSLHSHLACSMARKNIFIKVRERRNTLFHSATMETEEGEVAECIDDIVEILEDPKELRGRPDALEAVNKLKQLKESKFAITTNDEADVCKEAIMCVTQKAEELKQMIEEVKDFNERVQNIETNMSEKVEELTTDLCKRIGKVESDVSVLKSDVSAVTERVTSLEGKVRELDSKRDIYKRHLDYVKGKQELQAQLVKYYKKHYVKTSLSPLKQQQDDINIKDVYVTPEIEVIEEEKCVKIDKNTTKKPGKRYTKGYHEIFQTKGQQHKKIYILGDVGTGKSTFCKMMIENWCNAVSGRTNESVCNENDLERSETVSSDINMGNEFDDVCQMGQYEFLFFIPLQYMSVLKTDVTVDMIKELTRDLFSDKDLVDRIFLEDSMRCLIIIDSLDEWTPPKDVVRKPHVSYGIPNGDQTKDATVLTLSRPSAKGILNLKNSEIDLKLQLLGLSSSSLKSFIDRYISNTTSTEKSYYEFISIMIKKQICHIEQTPLLLQQILWLYCNDMELGKSVSETYCQIFNIMCGWSDHKIDGNDVRNDATGDKNIFLPENVQIYPRFKNNKRVLYLMGATAFDILTSGSIRNIFGRQHLLDKGLSVDDVTKLIQFGILKESNCFDQTQEDTHFSFIHMSYLEFFAALYVTSNGDIKETECLREKEDEKQEVLEKLFGTCESAIDILQLSNVIKMVCGLSPILIGDLSKRISCIVNEDVHILYLRRHGYKMSFRNDEIIQIQRLMVECLKECGSFDNTMISISDLCINDIEPSIPLQRINTNDVMSLSFEETTSKHVVDYITQCKQLQHVYIKHVSFSYEELSFLSQIECVKQLTLRWVKVADSLHPGTIDLSGQKQLQILQLISCMNIRISYLVTEHLEQVYIKDCPNVFDFKLLSNAIRLTNVYIETYNIIQKTCFGKTYPQCHIIDMSRQNHLRTLTLVNNPGIEITGLNVDQLEEVNIQYINEYYNSKDTNLLSYTRKNMELYIKNFTTSEATLIPLLQKTTLRQVTLSNVKCFEEKHIHIDLSGQTHLQTLTLVESPSIVITRLNPELLQNVHIDNSHPVSRPYASTPALEFELRSSARNIAELYNCGQIVNTKILEILPQITLRQLTVKRVSGDQHEILLDLSQQNHLQILKLSDCKNIRISGLNTEKLEQVYIINCLCVFDFDILSNASNLSEIHLEGLTGNMTSLVSLVEHASLRHLTLIGLTHCQSEVEGQTRDTHLDLSKQNHLQILKLLDCKQIKIIGLNIEELTEVHIHVNSCECVFDFDILSNTSKLSDINLQILTDHMASFDLLAKHASLRQLTLEDVTHCLPEVEGQTREIPVDLFKQNHIQILKRSDCKHIKISDLNTEELKEVHIINCKCVFDFDLSSNASKLSEIHLEGLTCNMAALVSLVEHASLRHLVLIGVTHCQSGVEGETREIPVDLSKQNHLQILKMLDCKQIKIIGLNTEKLEAVHIINGKCVFDFDFSSNASKLSEICLEGLTGNMASLVSLVEHASLRQLTLKGVTHCQPDVEGQTHEISVDLSKQNHLQVLKLSDCKNMKIIGLNIENLILKGVTHCQPECEGQTHEIHVDLSKQNHLQICTLLDCQNMNKSDLSTEHFEWFQHENCPGILKIELLGNARGLTKFIFTGQVLGDRYQFRKQEGYLIHTLHRLRTLNLQNVDIDANALTLIPEMVFLDSIFLEDTNMSIDTWRSFVDSIITLQQSVVIKVFDSGSFLNEEQVMKYHYVKNNPLFKMTKDYGAIFFCFQRREPE